MMTPDFDTAEERARLAAADLVAAANHVIAMHAIRPEDAQDDVDFAVLSRRFTSYAPSRTLDDARDDLDFASRAQTEVGSVSASMGALATAGGEDAAEAEAGLVGRLVVLAARCERRAVVLRS
jgi:hypothetical protein